MAEPKNTAKLERLEQQIDAERADLVHTIDHLQRIASGTVERIKEGTSVKALKADAGRYAGQAVSGALVAARDRALANPLGAVALGAGLAYPLVKVLKLIPPPLLMLGAGLALASRGGAETAQGHQGVAREGTESPVREPSHHDGGTMRSQVSSATHDFADAGRRLVHDGIHAGSRMVDDATDWTTSSATAMAATAHRTADGIGRTGRAGGKGVLRGVQDHPLVAGGIVALIGGIVAAAIPSTVIEDDLYGGAGDAVKAKAANSARHGLDVVEEAAGRVVESTYQAAEEQGLTPDSVKVAAQGLAEKVQGIVADSADDLTSAVRSKSSDKRDA